MTRYSHAFDMAFEIITNEAEGRPTPRQIREALLLRLAGMPDDELLEAVGAPFDSYEVLP